MTFDFNELLNMIPVDNILLCVIYFHYPKKSFSWINHNGYQAKIKLLSQLQNSLTAVVF